MQKAFTLIELLVVVLIIGILAAIALPQYQKAVFKSRMAEAFVNLKTLKNALDVYELEHGRIQVSGLDVDEVRQALSVSIGDQYWTSENFQYVIDRGSMSDTSEHAVGAHTLKGYDICICLHDDGHFSTNSSTAACRDSSYPSFNVAKTLGIEEDESCWCC